MTEAIAKAEPANTQTISSDDPHSHSKARIAHWSAIVSTGLLPSHIKDGRQAYAIELYGEMLRIHPMRAMTGITVIKGKPTLSAELIHSLIRERGKPYRFDVLERSEKRAAIRVQREPTSEPTEYQFTIQDAQRAGLAASATYKSYPSAMLFARCVSIVGRCEFPDVICGAYVEGEVTSDPLEFDDEPDFEVVG